MAALDPATEVVLLRSRLQVVLESHRRMERSLKRMHKRNRELGTRNKELERETRYLRKAVQVG